jgi:release factor glutamine methyltransferase
MLVLQEVSGRLRAAGCVAAEEEARQLLAAAGGDSSTLEALLRRREQGEPLAWITGKVDFCGRPVLIDRGVYVPRVQSERLAQRATALLAACGPGARAVDLCAGSGAIAAHLAAEMPEATVVAVDRDRLAAVNARRNGVAMILGDLGRAIRPRSVAVVTAVAPYVPTGQLELLPADVVAHEPLSALDGGRDGLAVVRRVVEAAATLLRPGGWLLLELGGTQDREVAPTLRAHGFASPASWHDGEGDLRGIVAQRG